MTGALASLRGITRRFGPVTALESADLEVRGGEVHGVLGENGAGKTTLLGILGGMVRPDSGEISIRGEPVHLSGPRAAWAHGIGLVHQHFALVPRLSVLENLALGRDRGSSGIALPMTRVRDDAEGLMLRTGLRVPLDEAVEDLGVGDKQRVEILKALLREPPILVLDEPTAVLAPSEVDSLFRLLRELADAGRGVVLVAHKIDEVLAVSDRVTVLCRGRTVLSEERTAVDARALIEAMVGDEVSPVVVQELEGDPGGSAGPTVVSERERAATGPPVASLADVHLIDPSGSRALAGVSLTVARGEIVGVAGVEGNGQRELALVLTGRARPSSGSVDVSPGIGFVSQDRTVEGIVPEFDLVENVALALHDGPGVGRGPILRWPRVRERTEEVVERFGVVTPGVEVRAGTLSGGNQQRLVVGRELLRARDLLVAENPTRGLDVAATAFVHREIEGLASAVDGPGIVLISTDLDEVLALSSRILVMVKGRLLEVAEGDCSRAGVGRLMLSGGDVDARA